jgi:hypothetical protein
MEKIANIVFDGQYAHVLDPRPIIEPIGPMTPLYNIQSGYKSEVFSYGRRQKNNSLRQP